MIISKFNVHDKRVAHFAIIFQSSTLKDIYLPQTEMTSTGGEAHMQFSLQAKKNRAKLKHPVY